MNMCEHFVAIGAVTLCTGCASTLSGVGGSDQYACKAPEGVQCASVAGVYANSVANNPPAQRAASTALKASVATVPARAALPSSTTPLRTPARVLRLWIAPWEDQDGDLYEQSLVHIVVDQGRWRIEHERRHASVLEGSIKAPLSLKETGKSPATSPAIIEIPARSAPTEIEP